MEEEDEIYDRQEYSEHPDDSYRPSIGMQTYNSKLNEATDFRKQSRVASAVSKKSAS